MSAYYNYGRWVVDCPAPDCHAALRVSEASSVVAVRMVCDCQDEDVCDHQQIPCGHVFYVTLPDNRHEIEAVAGLRPRRANRNWIPGESLEDLKVQNLRHGVRI